MIVIVLGRGSSTSRFAHLTGECFVLTYASPQNLGGTFCCLIIERSGVRGS